MTTEEQIEQYIASQTAAKQTDLRALHDLALRTLPGCQLWFTDGKNEEGKVVANPNIGYGHHTMKYADGTSREFYRIGLSANTSGISVYILGIEDKAYLSETFGKTIGKATVTGYCIRFKKNADIDLAVLQDAIRYGAEGAERP